MQSYAKTNAGQDLRLPRAIGVAGVIFSVLMIVSLGIIRFVAPANLATHRAWLTDPLKRHAVEFALHLVPFAGVAFLWFMGVLRSRLGNLEDRFFATVFLGSGLMFVTSLFGATALAGALMEQGVDAQGQLPDSETYAFVRRAAHALVNVFAIKMAAVFIFSTCTIALRTALFPRWLAFLGFGCGLVLLVVITSWEWIALLFPLWILVVSAQILVVDLHRSPY